MTLKSDTKLEEKLISCSKNHKIKRGIWQIFSRALQDLKIGTLMGSFYPKEKMCDLKTYRRVMCHDTEE